MKIILNEDLIKRNKKIGNILSIAGIAILAAGLILNFNPDPTKTLISFGALIIGFIVAQISTYYVSKFGRTPRVDEIIADNLSKLNNNYSLYVYHSPVPMFLTGPSGVWVPTPISASGEIYYDKKWKQKGGSFLLKFFGQENIGRPGIDVETNERKIREFLGKILEDEQIPPINNILVVVNPKAKIGEVEEAPLPIVDADGLRRKIRKEDRQTEEEVPPMVLNKINLELENYA